MNESIDVLGVAIAALLVARLAIRVARDFVVLLGDIVELEIRRSGSRTNQPSKR